MLVCGIDIGTTNLKVALFDENNRLVWLRTEATPRMHDTYGSLTDAASLLQMIEGIVVQGWYERGEGRPILAIASAGVGEDGLFVDADLEPLSPAIPWFDQRARLEASELASGTTATPRAGIAIDPTRSASKWLWSARHTPQIANAANTWLCLTDFPLAKWAATPFISDTLASRTGCFDPVARKWIDPLLSASHAPPMPPVVAAGSIVGTLQSHALLDSGAASRNTLLVAGGHDHPVAAHAIHRLATSARVDSMGTANVIYGDAFAFSIDAFDSLIAFTASIEGPGNVGCLGVFEFTAAVNRYPPGMEAIRRVLALRKMPGPAGDLSGPSFNTERELLEWATMSARRMLERLRGYGVPDGPIFVTGGWSRSRALVELRASLFGEPIHVPEERELTVLGAALLAARAAGGSTEFKTPITVVEPIEVWRRAYADAFARISTDIA
jgi:xylulokinase